MNELIAYIKGPALAVVIIVVGIYSGRKLMTKLSENGLTPGAAALEEKISKDKETLEGLKQQLSRKQAKHEEQVKFEKLADKLASTKLRLDELRDENASSSNRIESLNEGLKQTEQMYADYRKRYRDQVRSAAVDTELDRLDTLDGKVYRNVQIKAVGAMGMNITHSDGSCRIPFQELPLKMQRHYQFDEEEAIAQQEREAEALRLRRQALAKQAAERLDQSDELKAAQEAAAEAEAAVAREKRNETIKQLQEAIEGINEKISRAQSNITLESKKSISRAPQYRTEIKRLEKIKSEYQDKIRELRNAD